MTICKTDNCNSIELVYSGVDAFVLGVPTETYCYDCANRMHYDKQYGSDTYEYKTSNLTTSC
jgi:hypothetical protein